MPDPRLLSAADGRPGRIRPIPSPEMVLPRDRWSFWDHPLWRGKTALVAGAVAPVVVATGVTAHYRVVPADKAVVALVASLLLGFGVDRLRPGSAAVGDRLAVGALVAGAALGIWLAATSSWWLVALGVLGVGIGVWLFRAPGASGPGSGLASLLGIAAIELLAGWGTTWVELGRLPWLGLLAAILPASLAAAIWLLAQMIAQSPSAAELPFPQVLGLSQRGARNLFHGLLLLALAVPLLLTIPGLDGAECFLPWILAPLGEGPLRNSISPAPLRRARAVRQLAVLLLGSCALLAVGVWTG